MKIIRNFLVGVIIGIVTIIYSLAIMKSLLGESNVSVASGATMNSLNIVIVVLAYGVGTAVLSWIGYKVWKSLFPERKK